MTDEIIALLKDGRARKSLSQQQVADHLGVSRAAVGQWESGTTKPSYSNFIRLKMLFEEKPDPIFETPEANEEADRIAQFLNRPNLKKPQPGFDVPVTMMVGAEFGLATEFNNPIFYVKRPERIFNGKLHAVQIYGSSMFPKYETGEIVYAMPAQEANAGQYVIIEYKMRGFDGLVGAPFLRRISGKLGNRIELQQFNPPDKEIIEEGSYRVIARLLHWSEAFPVRSAGPFR